MPKGKIDKGKSSFLRNTRVFGSLSSGANGEWQRKGETMSLSNACAKYGVTVEEVAEAKLPCTHRCSFGNRFALVKRSDVAKLAAELQEEADQELQFIHQHGDNEEALDKCRKDQKAKKEAAAVANKAAEKL